MVNIKKKNELYKNNVRFKELIRKQRKTVPNNKKLQLNDIKRICKYIKTSIFDKDNCCIWHGYITNKNNATKGIYINFYFKKKKVALHRLLYINFIGDLHSDEYLKFDCSNKGACCNMNHLKKYKYRKKKWDKENDSPKKENYINIINNNCGEELKKKLYLTFE